MTFEMSEILKSKREMRGRLAERPIAEKLRLLDELHERSLVIAAARPARASTSSSAGTTSRRPG